ncbi:14650_t:CDS:2 [Cetraspora pellucida]|uniref:14650_t:CDS:1 n=1 Tax=Cetraspora pellucida TaxID=1433469 RepID=A0A9N8ZD31_9GLOM|nr:14650_t:CDS:2 [Cetraspora pellucida]
MASTPESHSIQMDQRLDKHAAEEILEIVCSPKMKYIAVLNKNYQIKSRGSKLFAVSDNKEVSIKLIRTNPYNFTIYNSEIDNEVLLRFRDQRKEIDFLSFIDNGNLIMINARDYRAYVFETKDTECEGNSGKFYFIAAEKGERLLLVTRDQKFSLMDPYKLTNKIDASKLFEINNNEYSQTNIIQEPFLIKSDKIIYSNGEKLLIKELVHDNWIDYLRKDLGDTNSITAPSRKTITVIKNGLESISDKHVEFKEFRGRFLLWKLECHQDFVMLKASKLEGNLYLAKVQQDILPSFYQNGKEFILQCELLDSDDLVMITYIGVIVWTIKSEKIRIHYYWNDWDLNSWDGYLENADNSKKEIEKIFNDKNLERILPASSYAIICKNLDVEFGKDKVNLFREFLKDSVYENFYFTCYGKELMEKFILLNDDALIRILGDKCIKECVKDNTHATFRISLLSIIFDFNYFSKLLESHPAFITSILTKIAFVLPSLLLDQRPTSSHLFSYGVHYHLSRTSFIDILTSDIFKVWTNFKENHKPTFFFH